MEICSFFFVNHITYTKELLCPKGISPAQTCAILQCLIWHMEENENFGRSGIDQASRAVADFFGVNHKKILMPLLFATIMGKTQGPPLFDSVELLGKERTRARMLQAMDFLGGLTKKQNELIAASWKEKQGKETFAQLV